MAALWLITLWLRPEFQELRWCKSWRASVSPSPRATQRQPEKRAKKGEQTTQNVIPIYFILTIPFLWSQSDVIFHPKPMGFSGVHFQSWTGDGIPTSSMPENMLPHAHLLTGADGSIKCDDLGEHLSTLKLIYSMIAYSMHIYLSLCKGSSA